MTPRYLKHHNGEQIVIAMERGQWRAVVTDCDGEPLKLTDYKGQPMVGRLWTEIADAASDGEDMLDYLLESRHDAAQPPMTQEEREASDGFDAAKLVERKSA